MMPQSRIPKNWRRAKRKSEGGGGGKNLAHGRGGNLWAISNHGEKPWGIRQGYVNKNDQRLYGRERDPKLGVWKTQSPRPKKPTSVKEAAQAFQIECRGGLSSRAKEIKGERLQEKCARGVFATTDRGRGEQKKDRLRVV